MVESHPTRDIGRVFVGRRREMADLKAALDDALSGHGQMVMLAGEPGIGKTRIAQELASYAEQRGAQVLWGWCYEGEGAPPYWPWVQLMRAYVQQAGAEQLTAEMGPGAADIAEIVPEIRGKLPNLAAPPLLDPEPARFRLYDSITTFLKNAAQRQPLMLVLDDLHWADRSSLLLLEFLAREIGTSHLLLVGAYRDVEVSRRHPLSQTLGALVREQIFHRVQLDGLTQQEIGELVEGSAGITLTLEAAEAIHKRTDGNPFFVGEITRQVTLENITEDQGWTNVIPEGVRDAIGRRLNRMSDQCNQMLTTASVIGQEFEFRLLNSLMGDTTEDQLLAAMDEAVGAHLIEELPQSVGRYQFTHALIRETLLEELSTTRRVRLHARIAQAMEELYGDNAETPAAELAHHFSEAQTELGADKLARYSLMAGERALATYAYEDALAHFESGLVARDITQSGTEVASDEEAAALLFGLARAQSATFEGRQLGEAFATLSRAFEYYVEAGNVALVVAAAEFPFAPPILQIPGVGVAQLIARALTLVPADSHEAGRLLSRYGEVLGVAECDYEGAEKALERAIAIARREGNLPLEV
ncbi:MAG: AAA family ATPase, partial [Chloroflexi bacterium]|nr:AAA family ATPase [Chloroflexota bacterium]